MKILFNDKINITIHLEEMKIREVDKLAKILGISRNKLILSSIDYALDNKEFLDYLVKRIIGSDSE